MRFTNELKKTSTYHHSVWKTQYKMTFKMTYSVTQSDLASRLNLSDFGATGRQPQTNFR